MFACAHSRMVLVLCGLSAFTVVGCGGGASGRPDLYPVSGTVMYNGEPVEGATVSFMAEGAPRAATGVTNAEGKFQLTTFDVNDGAVPGTHTVTVSKMEAGTTPADPTSSLDDPTALQANMDAQNSDDTGPKWLTPEKYASPTTSGLKEEVKADGENIFVIQLSD